MKDILLPLLSTLFHPNSSTSTLRSQPTNHQPSPDIYKSNSQITNHKSPPPPCASTSGPGTAAHPASSHSTAAATASPAGTAPSPAGGSTATDCPAAAAATSAQTTRSTRTCPANHATT
ncbi:hypothetical protein H0G86_006987 [Trichoderma simmonsii]|uniref:Uncharacterized protein n=1 Tax=Trichoderma simmonsii TaxID=1491479 RepID=A0A8G0PHW5_9HYPO|nr:hypothetical protein H0G86_006987 [Trichoderma simmonsii]